MRSLVQFLVARHRDRSRHRQHGRLRSRARASSPASLRSSRWRSINGVRKVRAVGDDAKLMMGKTPDEHPHHPPAARRRHRRPRSRRGDDQAFHPQGAWRPEPLLARAGGRHLHPFGRDVGRAPRDPRRGHQRRRRPRVADRGADGRGDRRGAAGRRPDRVDGRRHRRRHDRSRRHLAPGPRLHAARRGSAATRWTKRSPPTSAATSTC